MSQVIINGLAVGGVYGLLAVAFTIVYGVLGMVNFAFGEVFMFGSFGALVASSTSLNLFGHQTDLPGVPWYFAVPIGMVVGALVGWLVERLAYKPLRSAPILSMLIVAIAVSMLLRAIGTTIFGAAQVGVPEADLGDAIHLLGARVHPIDIVILLVAITAATVFALVVKFTSVGRSIRAVAMDRKAASLMGINVDRVISVTFILGSLMAALAGILYSQRYGFASAAMGFIPGLKALVAAVLGGIGSVVGAFAAGMLIGVTEELAAAYVPQGSAYRDVIAFALLIIFLWLRPQGLFGRREVVKV